MLSTKRNNDLARLLLRIGAGGLLLPHGLGKLFGWFGGPGIAGFQAELAHFGLPSHAALAWALALVQSGSAVLMVLGLWTRPAALLAAAFLSATVLLNAPNGWFWMGGGVEYPALWTVASLCVALLGPGAWSLDGARFDHPSREVQ